MDSLITPASVPVDPTMMQYLLSFSPSDFTMPNPPILQFAPESPAAPLMPPVVPQFGDLGAAPAVPNPALAAAVPPALRPQRSRPTAQQFLTNHPNFAMKHPHAGQFLTNHPDMAMPRRFGPMAQIHRMVHQAIHPMKPRKSPSPATPAAPAAPAAPGITGY